jgi:DNA-binding transcriptional LysR family regulator
MVRIGGSDGTCQHLLPPVLKEFLGLFPKVQLQVTAGHSTSTLSRVLGGELDLGLVTLPV